VTRPLEFILIGTGGHSKSVYSLLSSLGYETKYFLDEHPTSREFLGREVFSNPKQIADYEKYSYSIAIGDNNLRRKIRTQFSDQLPTDSFPTIIHPSASIGMGASIGLGTVIFPFVNVGAFSTIDEFCILNTSSNLEHDSMMGAYSALAPGAILGGGVEIGSGSWIGMNSTVLQGISIGNDSVIGANTFVNGSVPPNVVFYGSPGRVIKKRKSDEKFL